MKATAEHTVSQKLGYSYEDTRDDPAQRYAWSTALQAELRERNKEEVAICLNDVRAGKLRPAEPLQSLHVALARLNPIGPKCRAKVLEILDAIPGTKPETPEQTLTREAEEQEPTPWGTASDTMAWVVKIKRLLAVDQMTPPDPWPTLEEYLMSRTQAKAQAAATPTAGLDTRPGLTEAQFAEWMAFDRNGKPR